MWEIAQNPIWQVGFWTWIPLALFAGVRRGWISGCIVAFAAFGLLYLVGVFLQFFVIWGYWGDLFDREERDTAVFALLVLLGPGTGLAVLLLFGFGIFDERTTRLADDSSDGS